MTLSSLIRKLRQVLIPTGSVAERTAKSGIWATLINVLNRTIQLGKVVVLARFLSPADFGLMGIALLTLAVLENFTKLGVDAALIQRVEENVDAYLNTAWVMKLLRWVSLAGLAVLLAPYAATFFGEPRAKPLIQVIALTNILTGLKNPGVMYLKKNLEFHKQFVFTLSGTVINAIVTIAFGVVYQNVWALVAGYVAGNIVTLVVSYLIHDYRPRFEFDIARARELFGYGKWMTASAIVLFFINQGDDGFVGWFLGASALGFYQMAYRFSNAPATEVTQVITSVVFPMYSQIQEKERRLREGFFKTLQLSTTVAFPMSAGIIMIAPSFVRAFFGEEWLPMILPMQILALWGAVRSLDSNAGPLFKAIGRPDYLTKILTLKLVLITLFIYPATARWGTAGTAAVIVGASLVANPIADYLCVKATDSSLRRFVTVLLYPTAGSLVMAIGILAVQTQLPSESPAIEFFLSIGTGIVVYFVVMLGIDKRYGFGFESTFRELFNYMS